MMVTGIRYFALGVAWVVVGLGTSCCGAAVAEVDQENHARSELLANIWRMLEERQNSAETADVVWMQNYLMTGASSGLQEAREAGPAGIDGTDLVQEQRCRYVISGPDRLRVEGLTMSVSAGRVHLLPNVTSIDGTTRWSFADHSSLKEGHTGNIGNADRADLQSSVHVLPLTMALRPLRPEAFGEDLLKWKIGPVTEVVDGVPCLVLKKQLTGRTKKIYLDPNRSFVPLKRVNNSVTIVMRYDRSEEPRWVPSSWTSTVSAGPGGPLESESENELVSVSIGEPLDADAFKITFPEGTRVLDFRQGGRPVAAVASEGGELVPMRLEVANKTTAASSSYWWPLLLMAAGAAALGLALLARRRRTAGG